MEPRRGSATSSFPVRLSSSYVDELAAGIAAGDGGRIAARVSRAVRDHEGWRNQRLNLLASDNVISRSARGLLASDLATRISEGMPGARDYPPPPINQFADEIEGIMIALARRLFGAAHVEWRPQSTSIANLLALHGLTQPGDRVMVQADFGGGGNFGYQEGALPAVRGLAVDTLPVGDCFSIDLDQARELILRRRPRVLLIGGGTVLFPYPMRELRLLADEVGAGLIYDAAHLGLLVATGQFQDPLREGADILTTGTHKVAGGPIGGLVVTEQERLAERIAAAAYPGLIQTRDQNKFAAAAFAMAEMLEFGEAYSEQMVANARAFGKALVEAGFSVVAADRGFTSTHQLVLDLSAENAGDAVGRLISCGLLVQASYLPRALPSDGRQGMRLSVQEATRRGMIEADMRRLATWFARALRKREEPDSIADEVKQVMSRFDRVRFSFDAADSFHL